MAETHELRLKIDAAAAKSGSREFTAAVDAIKKAVRDLERDSSGAFTKLRKNIKDASAHGNVKFGVDKQAIRDLNTFAAGHDQLTKSAASSEKSVKTLARTVQGLAESYRFASGTAGELSAAILKTNSALMRQIQLASQARSAIRQIGTAPTATTAVPTTATQSTRRSSKSSSEVAGLDSASKGSAKSVEAAQASIQRAVATSRTAVEGLTTSLMRLGGFGAMSQLHRDFQQFTNAASKAGITTEGLRNAQQRFAASVANARTSLVTLTATTRDEARAAAEMSKAEAAAELSTKKRATAQLAASGAVRSAESDVARLTARLRDVGDTRGIHQLSQALIQLKGTLSSSGKSALEIRAAMDTFARSTAQARVALLTYESAQKAAKREATALAQENRKVADSARLVERELRSIAGANNAVAKSVRDATGGMRGLENAFSASFQAGSLLRNMLGSLTLGTFTRSVFEAGDALDQFMVSMEIASGSASTAMSELDYVDQVASRLGVNIQSARDNYSKLAVSSSIAGVSASETQKIFESVSTALSVMGKSTVDQNLAFMALEQMMSKGTVSSEELRQQLGERLPGAVTMMAQALGVTVTELGKMLKAGEILSADALPKFADVLMEKFGPGLENAMSRAGNNLQKLRNEITFFLEEVAKSGFMQELAVQFRSLTDILSDGRANGAAQKLGQGLAMMARIGGESLQWIIENIDFVGKAIKAVAIGALTQKIASMGQAVATSSMQLAGYAAAWLNSTKYETAAEAATSKHTAALELNTAALLKNSGVATKSALTTGTFARSQEQAARRALTTQRSTTALTGVMGMFGAAAGAAAGAASVLSRALAVVTPIASLAVTALLLIPGALDLIGMGSDSMGNKIEAALARSGAKFDEFGAIVRENSAVGMMDGLLNDIQTLQNAAENLANSASGGFFSRLLDTSTIDALTMATYDAAKNGKDTGLNTTIATTVTGIDTSGLSGGAVQAAQDILQTYGAIERGQGSAVEMQKKLNDAMRRFPQAAEFFSVWEGINKQLLQAEQGVVNTKQRLTELYGTSDEKIVSGFVKMAAQVYRTGEGMDALKERQKELSDANPEMAATLTSVMDSWEASFKKGDSALGWAKSVESTYDGTARSIINMREEADRANQAFANSQDALREKAAQIGSALESYSVAATGAAGAFGGMIGVPADTIDTVKALVDQFSANQGGAAFAVSAENFQRFIDGLVTGTPQVHMFTRMVAEQFAALDQSEQSYARLDSIIRTTAAQFPGYGNEIASVAAKMLEQARAGDSSVMAFSDLGAALARLGFPTEEARAMAMAVLDSAAATQDLGNAAVSTEIPLNAAASGADTVASSAWSAVDAINAVAGALRSLFGMSGSISVGADALAANLREEARIATLTGADRAVADYWHKGEGARFVDESNKAIADLKAKAASTTNMLDKTRWYGEAAIAEVTLRGQQAKLNPEVVATYDANEAAKAASKKSGGSRGGRGDDEKLNDRIRARIASLRAESIQLEAVAASTYKTTEAAQLYAEALVSGNGSIAQETADMLQQIDAAAELKDKLTRLANDPVSEWLKAVPIWEEGARQIETSALGGLSSALSNLFQTGELDLASFASSVVQTMADVLADQTVKMFMDMLNVSGSVMAPTSSGIGAGLQTGSVQAGNTIGSAIIAAGTQVASTITTALTGGGATAGATMQTSVVAGGQASATMQRAAATTGAVTTARAHISGGRTAALDVNRAMVAGGQSAAASIGGATAGAGGGGGGLFGFLGAIFGFSEGGYSDRPGMTKHMVSPAAFQHAPHFAQGTQNTSGIPAILHPNEAVVPLSKNRKIPVDASGLETGGSSVTTTTNTFGDIVVSVQSSGDLSDPKESTKMAEHLAELVTLKIQEQLAAQSSYGGVLNPRGGR